MRKITLTEALNQLKLLDKKIDKTISNIKHKKVALTDVFTDSSKTGGIYNLTKEELTKEAKSTIQSLTDLTNRIKLKASIAQANATTKVNFRGKDYTIVEIIEIKNSMSNNEGRLLTSLFQNLDYINEVFSQQKNKADNKIENLLSAKMGSDVKNVETTKIVEELKKLYEPVLYDPANIQQYLIELDEYIANFNTNIDTLLSIVNATTYIEIDF